jgi:hypothetical protein
LTIVRRLSASAVVLGVSVLATPVVATAQNTNGGASSGFSAGTFVVFGVIFAIACALIANSKGRSLVLWGVLGFLFGLIPLIIILVMKRKTPSMYAGGQAMSPPPPPPPPL